MGKTPYFYNTAEGKDEKVADSESMAEPAWRRLGGRTYRDTPSRLNIHDWKTNLHRGWGLSTFGERE